MRNVGGALMSVVQGGSYNIHLDVLIERPTGASTSVLQSYRSFSGINWIRSCRLQTHIDQPIGTGHVVLMRESTSGPNLSLSPMMGASTLNNAFGSALDAEREVEVRVAITTLGGTPAATYDPLVTTYGLGDWIPIFQGVTTRVEFGGKASEVTVEFTDRSGPLGYTFILDTKLYGSSAGTAVETVLQQIVDAEIPGTYTLAVPASPGFGILEGAVEPQLVWDALWGLVSQFGWRLEQRWNTATKRFDLTLLQPDRTATSPVWSYTGPGKYIDITPLNIDPTNVRTLVRAKAIDSTWHTTLTSQLPAAASVATDPLILRYGKRAMQIAFDATEQIDTQGELDAFVASVYADVSTPPLPQEIESFTIPWAELGDYIGLPANGVHYDTAQAGGIVGIVHEFPRPGVGRTKILTATKPKGAYSLWHSVATTLSGFNAVEQADPARLDLLGFQETARTTTQVTVGWTRGPDVAHVFKYGVRLALPIAVDPRAAAFATAPEVLGAGENSDVIPVPPRGYANFRYYVPRGTSTQAGVLGPAGTVKGWTQMPVDQPPRVEWVRQAQGTATNAVDAYLRVSDPQGRPGTLYVWTGLGTATSPDPTQMYDASIAIGAVPAEVGPASLFLLRVDNILGSPLDDVRVHPARGKRIYAEFINNEGVTGGVTAFDLQGYTNVITEGDALGPGVVNSLNVFAAGFEPPVYLDALPVGGVPRFVVLTGDPFKRLHRWDATAGAYTTAVSGLDVDSLSATQIVASNLAAIAADLGVIVNGLIQNHATTPTFALRVSSGYSLPGTATQFIDAAATGSGPILKFNELTVTAAGDATFSGTLAAADGTFAGALSAATGTFSGALVAATGEFSGTVSSGDFTAGLATFGGMVRSFEGFRLNNGIIDTATVKVLDAGNEGLAVSLGSIDDFWIDTGGSGFAGDVSIGGKLTINGWLGVFGGTPASQQVVAGSTTTTLADLQAVVRSLLTALEAYNLIADTTT